MCAGRFVAAVVHGALLKVETLASRLPVVRLRQPTLCRRAVVVPSVPLIISGLFPGTLPGTTTGVGAWGRSMATTVWFFLQKLGDYKRSMGLGTAAMPPGCLRCPPFSQLADVWISTTTRIGLSRRTIGVSVPVTCSCCP